MAHPTCRFSTNATNQVEAISRDVGVMAEFDKSRQQRVAESHMKVPLNTLDFIPLVHHRSSSSSSGDDEELRAAAMLLFTTVARRTG